VGVVSLINGMKNRVRASIKNMWGMLFGEIVTIIVFFIYGYQKLAGSPAILYVTSQLVFLIASYRSYYYNIDSSVMDTIKAEGKIGYITFDKKKRPLGERGKFSVYNTNVVLKGRSNRSFILRLEDLK